MKPTILLALPLLVGGSAAVALPGVLPTSVTVTAGDYEALSADYDAAVNEWREALRNAEDFAAKRELRDSHPARKFQPKFAELAKGEDGDGRGLLWMAKNARDYTENSKTARTEKQRVYALLMDEHIGAKWFEDALHAMKRERRVFEDAELLGMYARVAEVSEHPNVQARAIFIHATTLTGSKDEAEIAKGKDMLRALMKSHAGTSAALEAQAAMITQADLAPGKPAPDFVGKTIDGHEFKLSDYKGKVVLVDFYGFW